MNNSVCVVIPMYNEDKIAEKCVDTVLREIQNIESNVGLIVVDAASKDKTLDVLRKLKKKYKNRLTILHLKTNTGYGGALRSGTKMAKKLGYEFVLFMDSDLTNNPKDIKRFISKSSDKVDCIKASRYSQGGTIKGVQFHRKLISSLGNIIAGYFFGLGIKDCTNGFRMVRISILSNIKFKENSFAIIMEELYWLKKRKANIISIPVRLTSRVETKTHFKYSFNTFYKYGKYAFMAALL